MTIRFAHAHGLELLRQFANRTIFSFFLGIVGVVFLNAIPRNYDRQCANEMDLNFSQEDEMKDSATDWASSQFRECLRSIDGAAAWGWLAQLGITPESAERFGIGYAPGDGDWLLRRSEGVITYEALRYSDLVREGAGGRSDRFADCLMFPIADQQGTIAGFTGPQSPGDGRWVTSRPNLRFKPERLLYGLHVAKEAVLRTRVAVVVSSPLDAIRLHQAGCSNVVASMGHLSAEQADSLYRIANEIAVIVPAPQTEADARRHRGLLNSGIDVRIESLASATTTSAHLAL